MGEWKKRTERAFEAFNRRDLVHTIDLADFDQDVEWNDPGLPGPLHGVAEVRMWMDAFIKAFPDAKMTIRDAVESSEAVALEFTWTGTHSGPLPMGAIPATGKQVHIEACLVYRITNGKISRVRVYPDNLTLLGQLGLAPIAASSPA